MDSQRNHGTNIIIIIMDSFCLRRDDCFDVYQQAVWAVLSLDRSNAIVFNAVLQSEEIVDSIKTFSWETDFVLESSFFSRLRCPKNHNGFVV